MAASSVKVSGSAGAPPADFSNVPCLYTRQILMRWRVEPLLLVAPTDAVQLRAVVNELYSKEIAKGEKDADDLNQKYQTEVQHATAVLALYKDPMDEIDSLRKEIDQLSKQLDEQVADVTSAMSNVKTLVKQADEQINEAHALRAAALKTERIQTNRLRWNLFMYTGLPFLAGLGLGSYAIYKLMGTSKK